MNPNYINVYNSLIRLTTNKKLYEGLTKQDTFSDRLILFLMHFAFFLKAYKNKENTKLLQEIYDFCFKQLELSIREIGYGDQSINKKMKDYTKDEKMTKISLFLANLNKKEFLVEYFNNFKEDLAKKNLNFFLKGVSNS